MFEFHHRQAVHTHAHTRQWWVHCAGGRDATVLEAVRGGIRQKAGAVC